MRYVVLWGKRDGEFSPMEHFVMEEGRNYEEEDFKTWCEMYCEVNGLDNLVVEKHADEKRIQKLFGVEAK